MSVFRL